MPTERPLEIDVRRDVDLAVVTVTGSAGMQATGQLNDCLVTLSQDPLRLLVIDMAELDFIGSEGLAAILSAYRELADRGGVVRLAGPTGPIRQMLDVTHLSKLLPIFGTVDEAVQA